MLLVVIWFFRNKNRGFGQTNAIKKRTEVKKWTLQNQEKVK